MADKRYILAIDQGTTSSKALLVGTDGRIRASSRNFTITAKHPHAGWVEFDPLEMLESIISAARDVMVRGGVGPGDIIAIGLANQGETVIAFDSDTGDPIYPAISWQDRRTTDIIERWKADGLDSEVTHRTGLRLDPYFSAAKLRWILDTVPRASKLLRDARLRFGTSDGWLLWKLTGRKYVTDVSTASRTMLMDLNTLDWDEYLLGATRIPRECLPEIVENAGDLCKTDPDIFGRSIPVTGLCVDQQAALFGQKCFACGQAKATYGTGCFVLANIGSESTARRDGLLTSVGWNVNGSTVYVFDGGIYSAGSVFGWLKKELGLYSSHDELEELITGAEDTGGVYLFPAFAGLASPHWEPNARAAFVGLTLSTKKEHILRAALESIAFRVKEIANAMNGPEVNINCLQVDGGLANSETLMQMQSDLLGIPLYRGESHEITALGAAMMAGLGAGTYKSIENIPGNSAKVNVFEPRSGAARDTLLDRYENWQRISQELIEWEKQDKII